MTTRTALTEDEIIRDWSLNNADNAFVVKFNKSYRLWIYLQLCALRLFGQLLDNPNRLDSQIIGYACKALKLPIVATVNIPDRDATRTEHKKLIFDYLGFSKFEEAVNIFHNWLKQKIHVGTMTCEQIYPDAEIYLIKNKIALPTTYHLKREINSFCFQQQEALFNDVYKKLPPLLIKSINLVLETIENDTESWFQKFKEYPGSATITLLQDYLQRYKKLADINVGQADLSDVPFEFAHHLYRLGRYYDAWKIKRFRPAKRYTLMAVFLSESQKIVIDYLIQMHDQYISGICRECKHIHEQNLQGYKRKNEAAIDQLECFIDYVLEQDNTNPFVLDDIYKETTSKAELQQARDDMRQYKITSKYGYAKLLQNRYSSMRRYFTEFIQLPFLNEKGSQDIQEAIDLIRQLDDQKISVLPKTAYTKFIDRQIVDDIYNQDGTLKRNLWEIGLAIAIKDGFRSGDLFVAHSNKHVSFWNLVYKEEQWKETKSNAYQQLGIEENSQIAVANVVERFHQTAKTAEKQFGQDDFADIQQSKLVLRKKDKIDIPIDVERLQSLINSYLPKIKIEQLLIEVDHMTGFTKHFTPIHGQESQPKQFYKTLIASILAQATNIGMATMQDCTTGITTDMMRYVTDSHIREETIKSSNAELVNRHSQLAISKVHGDGSLSSSDGQRFIITASSLLSSFYPRYCGYYEKIIGVYTHMSDQFAVYNTNAISCSPRESLYVVDGFLDNNTILAIKEHTTDTAGYTEHIFAVCFLLGIQFMPRIKDLKSQQLYRVDRSISYGKLDILLTKTVSLESILEQWDEMIRIVASLKNKLCPAHEIIRRLSKGSPSDKLSKAFTQLGRLLKTEYILRYITDSDLRNKVQRQLNKGEHRHALARWIFFANQGKFQVGDYEEIINKASCLSLVSNAVLYWNTIKVSEIICQLRAHGEIINDEILSHISLLAYRHVVPMGTYFTDEITEPVWEFAV